MTFNPSTDFARVFDGLVPVTLERRASQSTTPVPHALRRSVQSGESDPSQGRVTAADAVWHLPVSETPTAPLPGDVLVDPQGARWTVLEVDQATLSGRWRCTARNLILAHGLGDRVDIEQATYEKSDGGADQPHWQPWRTGLAARIQPVNMEVRQDHERLAGQARFKVYLAENVTLDHTHRFRGPDAAIYTISAVRRAERIDTFMEIDVVRTG